MIDQQSLINWRNIAPWLEDTFVEQDLIISRALVAIHNHPLLNEQLVFRGGTAMQKLFYKKQATRHSEDLDYVQIKAGPIGEIIDALSEVLEPWLGKSRKKFGRGRATLIYRFAPLDSQENSLKLKVEINTREHFSHFPLTSVLFEVDSAWFSDKTSIKTYQIDELLGTKLRALYQRKKGRDLYDLARAIENLPINIDKILECFHRYMDFMKLKVSRAEFEKNLLLKKDMTSFREDINPLLSADKNFSFEHDFNLVMNNIISKLPGAPLKNKAGQ